MKKRVTLPVILFLILGLSFFCVSAQAATVEDNIRNALQNKSTYMFEISDDHVFFGTATSSTTIKTDSDTTTYTNISAEGEKTIKTWSAGYVIRIDNGTVTMAKDNYYDCSLEVLDDGQGISIEITTKSSVQSFNSSIVGVIQGNLLTASQSVVTATYSSYADLGLGNAGAAQYQVTLNGITQNNYPPKAVVLEYEMKLGGSWGDTILYTTLTWEDTNDPGVVSYYEVYKLKGIKGDAQVIATLPAGTLTWVDEKPGTMWDMFEYYVISYTDSGIASEKSNICIF